jgi:UDP-N-acetylglucosamine 2-epimerase
VSQEAEQNLAAEGITDCVHWVGDVMLDALLYSQPIAHARSGILEKLRIEPQHYGLVTIHRAMNTDEPERLRQIMAALDQVSEIIILPIHPRTRKALSNIKVHLESHIHIIEPVGYFDMLILEENARLIATDSGGVQREAYYMGVPCLTLREESEWEATIKTGWNKLVGADQKLILDNWFNFMPPTEHPPIYGVGTAAQSIAIIINEVITKLCNRNKVSKINYS